MHRSIAARIWDTRGDASRRYPLKAVIYSGFLLYWRGRRIPDETMGPMTLKWTTNHAAMFRNSGAAGLLAP